MFPLSLKEMPKPSPSMTAQRDLRGVKKIDRYLYEDSPLRFFSKSIVPKSFFPKTVSTVCIEKNSTFYQINSGGKSASSGVTVEKNKPFAVIGMPQTVLWGN
jgi:hypothetical protein